MRCQCCILSSPNWEARQIRSASQVYSLNPTAQVVDKLVFDNGNAPTNWVPLLTKSNGPPVYQLASWLAYHINVGTNILLLVFEAASYFSSVIFTSASVVLKQSTMLLKRASCDLSTRLPRKTGTDPERLTSISD